MVTRFNSFNSESPKVGLKIHEQKPKYTANYADSIYVLMIRKQEQRYYIRKKMYARIKTSWSCFGPPPPKKKKEKKTYFKINKSSYHSRNK